MTRPWERSSKTRPVSELVDSVHGGFYIEDNLWGVL